MKKMRDGWLDVLLIGIVGLIGTVLIIFAAASFFSLPGLIFLIYACMSIVWLIANGLH
jgi:hypothetical protein